MSEIWTQWKTEVPQASARLQTANWKFFVTNSLPSNGNSRWISWYTVLAFGGLVHLPDSKTKNPLMHFVENGCLHYHLHFVLGVFWLSGSSLLAWHFWRTPSGIYCPSSELVFRWKVCAWIENWEWLCYPYIWVQGVSKCSFIFLF